MYMYLLSCLPNHWFDTGMVNDHFYCKSIVNIHEEAICRIVIKSRGVDFGNGINKGSEIGIFTVMDMEGIRQVPTVNHTSILHYYRTRSKIRLLSKISPPPSGSYIALLCRGGKAQLYGYQYNRDKLY